VYNISCVTATDTSVIGTYQRYALKREVADGASGNFRRVCPILNRATVITKHCVCLYFLRRAVSAAFGMSKNVSYCPGAKKLSAFFMKLARNTRLSG
jgi:hypothetical protein